MEDIMNAYYGNTNIRENTAGHRTAHDARFGDGLISLICNIIAIVTSSAAIKIGKALLCTALFVLFFGVVGSMDRGSMSMAWGVVICASISFVEFAILKSTVKKVVGSSKN